MKISSSKPTEKHLTANSHDLSMQLTSFFTGRLSPIGGWDSTYKASSYPKVYLSADLERRIHEVNLVQKILETPQRRAKAKRTQARISKPTRDPKLYSLASGAHNCLKSISADTGCKCCTRRSLSIESNFEKLIEEKRSKTFNAQTEYNRMCSRPKTTPNQDSLHLRSTFINTFCLNHPIRRLTMSQKAN